MTFALWIAATLTLLSVQRAMYIKRCADALIARKRSGIPHVDNIIGLHMRLEESEKKHADAK
jgi:hypothetical protein